MRAETGPTTISLDALASDPTLAERLAPAARAAIVMRCAVVLAAVAGPIVTNIITSTETSPEADRLLDVREAARRLNVSTDYVYRHKDDWPFTVRNGRKVGFSERGLSAHLRRGAST